MKIFKKIIISLILITLISFIWYYTTPKNPAYVYFKNDIKAIEALDKHDFETYFQYADQPYLLKHDNLGSVNLAYKYAMNGNYNRATEIVKQITPKQTYRAYDGCIEVQTPFRFFCAMGAKIINNNYSEIDINYTLSNIYTMQENYKEALISYQLSKTKNACHEAYLYAKLKNNIKATKSLSQCKKEDQSDLIRGIINENQGNTPKAFEYYLKSVKHKNTNALINLSTKYAKQGNQKQANKYAKIVLEQHPYHKQAIQIIK